MNGVMSFVLKLLERFQAEFLLSNISQWQVSTPIPTTREAQQNIYYPNARQKDCVVAFSLVLV